MFRRKLAAAFHVHQQKLGRDGWHRQALPVSRVRSAFCAIFTAATDAALASHAAKAIARSARSLGLCCYCVCQSHLQAASATSFLICMHSACLCMYSARLMSR